MAAFPTLISSRKADSAGYSVELEDPSIRTEIDGGYVVSRARHTRTPRRTFNVKYTDLPDADRITIQNFYNSQRGGSVIFDWTSPQDNVTYQVRFKGGITFDYTGAGNTQRWDCSFVLEQA